MATFIKVKIDISEIWDTIYILTFKTYYRDAWLVMYTFKDSSINVLKRKDISHKKSFKKS